MIHERKKRDQGTVGIPQYGARQGQGRGADPVSVDCFNDADCLHFGTNNNGWSYLYHLAEDHGWEPAGTVFDPPDLFWDGSYFSNDGQVVTAEDAAGMADAITRAMAAGTVEGRWRERIGEFVRFCRAGSFELW